MVEIDYKKISDSIDYYSSLGFKYLEVPWIVSRKADNITAPEGVRYFESFLGVNVASAEQSFLELILQGNLKPGKYVAVTPCFRDEKVIDELHKNYFMKVELIDFLGYNFSGNIEEKTNFVIDSAKNFFSKYLDVESIKIGNGTDIISNRDGIELGSYGARSHKNFNWIYGTGVAEPRLTQVVSKIKKGYHEMDIPKGAIGGLSKIYEEFREFEDSVKQGNKIMGLLELSDLVGAIELYLEKEYPKKLSLNDLIKMKDVTKRAFQNEKR